MNTPATIRLSDVTLAYDRHPVVHHLDGEIAAGALMAVAGPNGAGKSTLLKALAGIHPPIGGRIASASGRMPRVAYLPQSAELDRSFPISVYDLIAMGLWDRAGLFGGIGRGNRARIAEAIAAVGLTGFENRPIGTLSGGQLQRALFARLLLQDAGLILLDEPFTAIDQRTQTDLIALVRRWHGEGRTVVAVMHDLEMIRAHFPQTLLIAREPIAWGETGHVLSAEHLLAARRMIEAGDPAARPCARAA
jgi:zinc/manganese transport system ATP-binding protein